MLIDLRGRIERVTYTSEESGFTIARVKVSGRRDLVTVVGSLIAPSPGEIIHMRGEWTRHPKYGEQFKMVEYHSVAPATVHGIQRYLGSGLIRGIGPVRAGKIVQKFGLETLEIIEHHPERLAEVEGIGNKWVGVIREAWEAQKEIREVMIFLQSHGVSSGFAAKIFKQYGKRSIEVVRQNPFRLAVDIFGIGFLSADRIAGNLGIAKDAEIRVEAGILYVLHQLCEEGHVYFPYEPLMEKCREILGVERERVVQSVSAVALDKRIVLEDLNEELGAYQENHKAVYLSAFHVSETSVAERLRGLLRSPKSLRPIDSQRAVEWVQARLSIVLAKKQVEAVRCAAENKVMVVTGGPGTGKTTIVQAILKIFSRLGAGILLAAPTGRAARRMNETTGHEAKTIHRLLEYSLQKGGFQRNEHRTLACDLLVVDEASMIDTILMHHLLKAVPAGATLILVGDSNQLPSVGPGNVLGDIIGSGRVPVVELQEIFRQAEESLIVVNAHRINQGLFPMARPAAGRAEDFYFIEEEDPDRVLKLILDLAGERLPRRFGLDPVNDIQVIAPMHKGAVGTANLNSELQRALNPSPFDTPGGAHPVHGEAGREASRGAGHERNIANASVSRGGREFRLGDKVMQIKNDYEKEVFNGDIGRIRGIDPESQEVTISFDGRDVPYEYPDLDEVVLAYAISVHKSQGSEYPAVIIPFLPQHYIMLQRNLIYTAVTRGRKLVVVVGTRKALATGIRNVKTQERHTRLKERLKG